MAYTRFLKKYKSSASLWTGSLRSPLSLQGYDLPRCGEGDGVSSLLSQLPSVAVAAALTEFVVKKIAIRESASKSCIGCNCAFGTRLLLLWARRDGAPSLFSQ